MKAVIYTRVSTDNQAEKEFNSCEAQKAKIRAFISSQENIEVYKVYSDQGYSGANLDRPALKEMLVDIEKELVNFVVAYKIDRLTRSPKDFYQLIEIFEKHNVSFISITERFDTSTPSGRLLRNIMLTFAQFEWDLISERTKDKMLECAKKGIYGGGNCPFGYKRVNKKLVVVPEEAEIVQLMFETYVKTASLSKTCEILNKQGMVNRQGKSFIKWTVTDMLRKPVYTGKITHQGKVYNGIHEPIISEELFEQAQKTHLQKIIPKSRPVKNYLFPGLVVCKECGSIMTPTFTNKIRNNKRKRYHYYRCTSTFKKAWAACSIKHISAFRLDNFILENLKRISLDNQYLESLSFRLNNETTGHKEGLELWPISPEDIKKSLEAVVKTGSEKRNINRTFAIKNLIQKIIYSKGEIAVNLYTSRENEGRPKMPPPIFGRFVDDDKGGADFGGAVVCPVEKPAEGRTRTDMGFEAQRILSPSRLPIPPPRLESAVSV